MTWFHWVVKRLLWTPIVVSLEFNQNRAGLCMISMTCQLVHTLLTFLQWDPSLWIVFGRNLNGDHLGACANHRNGEFDVFQSLCPSNETRWRRTTFTTHGKVMQSTPNEDHYGPLQFQTIFLVHCCKITKFHRTSQDTFLLPMGQQTGRSIWITQWKIQMPARKGNEPCGHSAKLPAKCRFWRWVSKKQCWEQHQYAPCDAPSYIWHGAPQWDKVNHGHGTFWAAKISKWERDIDHFELGIGLILNEQVFSLGRTKQAWEGDNIFGQLIATWRPTAWNPICG